MKPIREIVKEKPFIGWLLFFFTIIIVFLLGLLASSVTKRQHEKILAFIPSVNIDPNEPRSEVWGDYYPREYQSYLKTADTTFRSKYNGSRMIDMLEDDPRLVILWAGYGFSKDYNQGRGHYYAVEDVRNTLRTGGPVGDRKSPMPNTCWACKSTDVPRLMDEIGIADFYKGSWEQHGPQIFNPIGCADCHDAKTMKLTISRPALIEAYKRMNMDITKASHQEMRSLVCAQCHVEYYFNKKEPAVGVPYLTFPWKNGFSADAMEEYYDRLEFSDWTHSLSRAPMLKAQHPDYEIYMTGIHAQRGVSCADCHMPFISEGGQKFTDHHLQSPLNNVSSSCQVCHREETTQLVKDVYSRQDNIKENRDKLEILLVRAHVEAMHAWKYGATEEQMKDILILIRYAQWRWDYAAASHGASFHSPLETLRVITTGIEKVQESRIKLSKLLADLGHNEEIPYPDISTKEKAQKYVGLPMEQLVKEKEEFFQKIIPEWNAEAEQRQASWDKEDI